MNVNPPIESLDQAISQHIRNQKSDEIPHLFHYAQLLIAINKNEAKYATGIIIITDRIELDGQIESTFKACGLEPKLATTSAELIKLIRGDVSIITMVINKFKIVLEDYCKDSNDKILALIDEGHRTQYGDLADNM